MDFLSFPKYGNNDSINNLKKKKEGDTVLTGDICSLDANDEIVKYDGTLPVYGVVGTYNNVNGLYVVYLSSHYCAVRCEDNSIVKNDKLYIGDNGIFIKSFAGGKYRQEFVAEEDQSDFQYMKEDGTYATDKGVYLSFDFRGLVASVDPTT